MKKLRLDALARTLVRETADSACAAARSAAPVDTGRLRGSLSVQGGEMQATVRAGCDYAAAVELGSARSAARPFLLPALRGEQGRVTDRAREILHRLEE